MKSGTFDNQRSLLGGLIRFSAGVAGVNCLQHFVLGDNAGDTL